MKKRILIVDDDTQLNLLNQKILTSSGIVEELTIATNGHEAIKLIKKRLANQSPLPELIILDLDMPVMDGFKCLDVFNSLFAQLERKPAIIIFTSSSNPKDKDKAFAKGANYFLPKPYLLRPLREIILNMPTHHEIIRTNERALPFR